MSMKTCYVVLAQDKGPDPLTVRAVHSVWTDKDKASRACKRLNKINKYFKHWVEKVLLNPA